MESCAAFTASVLGITRRERANSAIASCSREPFKNKKNPSMIREFDQFDQTHGSQQLRKHSSHHAGGIILQVDRQSRLHSAPTWNDTLGLQHPLDHAESVVQRTLHLVTHEVVGPAQNDGRGGARFGAEGINREDRPLTNARKPPKRLTKAGDMAAAQPLCLLFDQDELIIADALLHNLLGLTEHGGLKRLLPLQIC